MVGCTYDCGKQVKRKDLQQHTATECLLRKISCDYCNEAVLWNELEVDIDLLPIFIHYNHMIFPTDIICNPELCKQRIIHGHDNTIYRINCGVIQGFPALRKAVTTRVKKYCIFSHVLIQLISCLHVTCLWHHLVRLMNEQQSLHDSQYKLLVGAFSNYRS